MADEDLSRPGEEPPGRILIVDDVLDNRTILGRRFQRRGFEIAEADSGRGALELIEQQPFDVVLLDVMMPDMNGLEVLRRIRERHSDVALPVIMVTGRVESQDIVEALTLGANDYITKPVDFAVALLRVSTQVGRRRAEEQVRRASAALSAANADLERLVAARTAELVGTNEHLRAAIAEAQAANRSKDEFLATMSHELRTPLNGLIAMGQMLAKTTLSEPQQRMADIINSSAEALFGVVADLLDTLDLTSGRLTLSPTVTNVEDLLREAAAPAERLAKEKGLAFSLAVGPGAGDPVCADPQRLRQVVTKLLDNAVKFTEAGEVALAATRAASSPETLVIEVRDTGVGFDPDVAERLFRPFEQADGSLTRRFGGVGLGLAICRGLVDLMHGAISAEGRPGEGAVFRVEVPMAAQAT